jgi:ATP-dependent Clp protease protease subunit
MRYIIRADPRLELKEPYKLVAAPEIVYFEGEIDEESAALFRKGIELAECKAINSGQEILPVCIDSAGGCLYSLMGMVDAMEACSIKIATVVESKAMSAAATLLTCGDKNHRYMGKNATIMLHDASGGVRGTAEEIENDLKELKRLDKMSNIIMAQNCEKPKNFFDEEIKKNGNPEWYITAKEAKKLGLISHIGIPVLTTEITFNHSLKLK